MERVSTHLLRAAIASIALLAMALCVFGLPQLINSELDRNADFDYGWIFVGMYFTVLPFFYGIVQAFKLLAYIDKDQAFSDVAVQALRKIKYAAYTISAMYAAGMPYVFYVADNDDAPGLVALGLVIVGASFVLGTAAGVFQKLFQNAVDLKAENDLMV